MAYELDNTSILHTERIDMPPERPLLQATSA